ncbi:MAG: START domain-containing protein [bacterium]|nr:START domain-containing protein [bacterium]
MFLSQAALSQKHAVGSWQLKKAENGISVYSRDALNSKFKEVRSVFLVKTSLSSVVALLNDFDSYTQWVYRCGASSTVKHISEKEHLHYQSVIAPWPVDNRDFVVMVKQSQDPHTKVVTQKGTSVPEACAPVPHHVRIIQFTAQWTITPLNGGMVSVEYQLLVDPGGNIPAWLVNLAALEGPYDTALAMKEWIFKEKYQKALVSYIKEPE